MKLILLLLLNLLFVSCGQNLFHVQDVEGYKREYNSIGAEFKTLVQEFNNDFYAFYKRSPKFIPVNFKDLNYLSAYTVGVCYSSGKSGKEVFISINHWKNLTTSTKKRLIYHELGHCVLGRGHDDSFISFYFSSRKSKKSFMHSNLDGFPYSYHKNGSQSAINDQDAYFIEKSYVEELFTRKNPLI